MAGQIMIAMGERLQQDMERSAGNHGLDKGVGKTAGRRALIRNLGGARQTAEEKFPRLMAETLALLAVFTAATVVLMNVFLSAGRISREAEVLSGAVHLAENAAEMAAAADSGETLFRMLNEAGNACVLEEAADGASRTVYRARYGPDTMPAADGIFYVDVSWRPERDGLVRSTVDVYWDDGAEPVYALELAVYIGGL